jgi:hypothetical protein
MQQPPCKVRLQLSVATWTVLVLTCSNYGVLQHDFRNIRIKRNIGWTSLRRTKCDAMKHRDFRLSVNFLIQFESESLMFINHISLNIKNIIVNILFVVKTRNNCNTNVCCGNPTPIPTHTRTHARAGARTHTRTVHTSVCGTCTLQCSRTCHTNDFDYFKIYYLLLTLKVWRAGQLISSMPRVPTKRLCYRFCSGLTSGMHKNKNIREYQNGNSEALVVMCLTKCGYIFLN